MLDYILFTLCGVFGVTIGLVFGQQDFREKIIQDKKFCIESSTSGVNFKRCYSVKETK